jgi:hypothetical protein
MALCSIDDINSYLPVGQTTPQVVVEADDVNVQLIQISVARVVRGYLSRILSTATMAAWNDPENTPDIIREVAAMLVAAQLFVNQVSATSLNVEDRHWAQILYDRAVALLESIVSGEIVIGDTTPIDNPLEMTLQDFFPVDDTDRAFSMSLEL